MRRYETIYILRPTLGEEEVNEIIERTNTILTSGDGEIIALDKWGLRKLAYLIKKESNGYYVFCDYGTELENVTEMERKFRIDDAVMKYMTLKVADSIDAEGIEAARGDYEAAKVAAEKVAAEEEKEEQSDAKAKDSDQKPKASDQKPKTEESATEKSGE